MFGFIFGDYVMWFWVHRRLREQSEELEARTIPSFLAAGLPSGGQSVRSMAALITLAFLGTYASAQLSAGSKALHVLFGWDYSAGAIVGAAIVVIYCFAGGIRASIWTDVAQSTIMITAMLLLWIVALEQVGGWAALWSRLAAIDRQLINPFPADPRFGVLLYILGWLGAGVGVVGQPHIMVRAMACRSGREIQKARHIYLIWYLIFTAGCYGVALACRVLLPDIGSFDAELALPTLALRLLPGVLVGLVLAGLFSATMSTADSQMLSCSAALTQDLFPRWRYSYRAAKVGTVMVTVVVLAIALGGSQNVFALVTMSWSALAAGLGPLLVIRALRLPLGAVSALAVMGSGLLTVFVWSYGLGYSNDVFEVLPGMLVGVLVYLVLRPRASEA
jgi:sodium/proline symporter